MNELERLYRMRIKLAAKCGLATPIQDTDYFRNELNILNAMNTAEGFEQYARESFPMLSEIVVGLSGIDHKRMYCFIVMTMFRTLSCGTFELDLSATPESDPEDKGRIKIPCKETNTSFEFEDKTEDIKHRKLLDLFTTKPRNPQRLARDLKRLGENWPTYDANLATIQAFMAKMNEDPDYRIETIEAHGNDTKVMLVKEENLDGVS